MLSSFETGFIPKAIERQPFSTAAARNFLSKWCQINDSLVPNFISREEWQEKGLTKILEANKDGKQTLSLPKDLQLWEIVDIIRIIDSNTFAQKPENKEETANRINELGEIFQKAGLYLAEYVQYFDEDDTRAKEIAESVASEFYYYGLSLQHKQLSATSLTPEDKDQLDEWFLGSKAYIKRLSRLEEKTNETEKEELRKHLLKTYFKALSRDGYKGDGEKPWETKIGPFQQLQDRTTNQIERAIETPEIELQTTLFKRGLEKLVTEVREVGWKKKVNDFLKAHGFNPLLEQRKLYDTLFLFRAKIELQLARETGDTTLISEVELRIAKRILDAVRDFPYKDETELGSTNSPAEVLEKQFLNCVGASVLGGALLNEVGLKYLQVFLSEHAATVLLTADGKAYWQDFTPGTFFANFTEITPDMLEKPVSNWQLARYPANSSLHITFKEWNPYVHIKGKLQVLLLEPQTGIQSIVLNGIGIALRKFGDNKVAEQADRHAISTHPDLPYPYNGLGHSLFNQEKGREAVEAYKQAIIMNPEDIRTYYNLGDALVEAGRPEEAIQAYEHFIKNWTGDELLFHNAVLKISKLQSKK